MSAHCHIITWPGECDHTQVSLRCWNNNRRQVYRRSCVHCRLYDDVMQDIQSLPLMASTYSCEQEINTKTRVITKTTCAETHAFRPFAKWNSGATTEVTYKMVFRRVSDTNQRPDSKYHRFVRIDSAE